MNPHTPQKPTRLNPAKLLLGKWTAATPQNREKHFIVVRVLEPEKPEGPIEQIELEAVLTRRKFVIDWRELRDQERWVQGWK